MSWKTFCKCGVEFTDTDDGVSISVGKDDYSQKPYSGFTVCKKCAAPWLMMKREYGAKKEIRSREFCDGCGDEVSQTGKRGVTYVQVKRNGERLSYGRGHALCKKCAKIFNDWRDEWDKRKKVK